MGRCRGRLQQPRHLGETRRKSPGAHAEPGAILKPLFEWVKPFLLSSQPRWSELQEKRKSPWISYPDVFQSLRS